jgi:hypothetical protein
VDAAGAAPPAEGDLHGLWKVTSYLRQVVGTDEITVPMGAHPNGFLGLRFDHRALYILAAEGRKPFFQAHAPEEYRTAVLCFARKCQLDPHREVAERP